MRIILLILLIAFFIYISIEKKVIFIVIPHW